MLTYLTTSLFDSPAQTLVNTINTVGVMGKGIALVFKQLYPEMYEQYRELCSSGKLDIGKLYVYRTPHKIIVNFPTKKHWRSSSKIEYIEAGLGEFVRTYEKYGISTISFPQLGCGNGELDWERQVQPVMERHLKDLPIPVYIHLYPTSPDFVPERLDPEYTKQMQLERQMMSFAQVWQDLIARLPSHTSQLSLFTPLIEMDNDKIIFKSLSWPPIVIHRQDIEDLWNTLRLRGTITSEDIPQSIRANDATQLVFDFLSQLPYIQPVNLKPIRRSEPIDGLQYMPPPQTDPSEVVEIVM
ncbi:MAG: macro domain-containing protein [Anaerolineales bacterium]|nr:macro domain-containing protein [Anaerolineales bacterium]